MKRIKELGIIIYEIKDLKGRQHENAINNFIQKCITESKSEESQDSIYELTDEQVIEILDYNKLFFDKVGNIIPMYIYIDDEDRHLFHLQITDHLISEVTLENI